MGKVRPKNNPYLHGLYAMLNRVRWDLKLESWKSRQKLIAFKNKHRGEKAVIVCNGPSLLKSDLSCLDNVFTFGLNKINLLFENSDFRPSCIVAVNQHVIEQNQNFYNSTEIPLFLDSCGVKRIKPRKNIVFLHSATQNKFAQDCTMSIYQGATVTFVAMQLAFYFGFQKVALIGCDHSFTSKGPANSVVISSERDENHFSPKYFAGGATWQLPDLPQSEMAYAMAKKAYYEAGRQLVNCTEGGVLEIFDRMILKEFVAL